MFKAADAWGIAGGIMLLIFIYLLLNNYRGAKELITSSGSSINSLAKTLQGR